MPTFHVGNWIWITLLIISITTCQYVLTLPRWSPFGIRMPAANELPDCCLPPGIASMRPLTCHQQPITGCQLPLIATIKYGRSPTSVLCPQSVKKHMGYTEVWGSFTCVVWIILGTSNNILFMWDIFMHPCPHWWALMNEYITFFIWM